MKSHGLWDDAAMERMANEVNHEIEQAVRTAQAAAFPAPEMLLAARIRSLSSGAWRDRRIGLVCPLSPVRRGEGRVRGRATGNPAPHPNPLPCVQGRGGRRMAALGIFTNGWINPMIRQLRYCKAIHEALDLCLAHDPRVYLIGLGVPDPKGVFESTSGLQKKYGPNRVMDMPASENGITGIVIGSALVGMRPVLVHQRVDFAILSFDTLVNQAAKWHYMFGGKSSVPMVVRMIVGRGWGQGSQHAQSLQSWLAHVPGLKVIMPATPHDAKGMLISAIEDNNPVVCIEHRWLFNIEGPVPQGMYRVPLGEVADHPARKRFDDRRDIAHDRRMPAGRTNAGGPGRRRRSDRFTVAAAVGHQDHPAIGAQNRSSAGGGYGMEILWRSGGNHGPGGGECFCLSQIRSAARSAPGLLFPIDAGVGQGIFPAG